ncbi:MAG: hypothetical protein J7L15_01930 [Clostridiales bacterium]|nr:hypothetical protein [Clostridiales bacterium]
MNVEEIENKFVSGVVKQPEDSRDFIFRAPRAVSMPIRYKNPNIREIENQLSTGSCVANATCSSLEMMYTQNTQNTQTTPRSLNLSRMFVYYNAREPYENLKEKDQGAYMRDGFKSINHLGVCSEDKWEFKVLQVNKKPSQEAYEVAKDNMLLKYERLQDITSIKIAVLNNQAVIFGIPLKSDFFRIKGPIATHNYEATGTNAGGHAMAIVGYDDELNGFIIENSWGTSWGDNGLALIKYDIFEKYYFDVWTATELDFEKSLTPVPTEPEVEEVEVKDNLTKIIGIGKVYQKKLNQDGFYSFDAVANMTEQEIQRMEVVYSFKGDFKKSVLHAKELKELNV